MTGIARNRRQFLATTALGGLGLVAFARSAGAFTQQKMTAVLHREYLDRCSSGADPYHQQLADEAATNLKGKMSDAAIQEAVAAMRCPICGCAIVAAAAPAPAKAAAKAG